MNKGTYDGDIDEIKFVKKFNSNKKAYKDYLDSFTDNENCWMVRVTTRQISSLNNKKVFTRSDCYLARFQCEMDEVLKEENYYLSEELLENKNIKYLRIDKSGVSVKMTSSDRFQILKTGPNSFKCLFGCFELGAGASLFCQQAYEMPKNQNVITGWNTSIDKMNIYFSKYTKGNSLFYLNQTVCQQIKTASNETITDLINNSSDLQRKIFNGIGVYDEPYCAYYFYHGNQIQKLTTIPFSVTTGSGRSKGDYTIVLKPN